MPQAGGISAPVITPLRLTQGSHPNVVDNETYLELETDTPNTNIFFTADGSKPDPFKRMHLGRERTFKYKGPFTLNVGKRTIKALAVHRVTKQSSAVVTKTLYVEEVEMDSKDTEEEKPEGTQPTSRLKALQSSSVNSDYFQKELKSAWGNESHTFSPVIPPPPVNDHGFNATSTNGSGTQINFWGMNPSNTGWHMKNGTGFEASHVPPAPVQQTPMVTQEQLSLFANRMNNQLEQSRQMTVADVRNVLSEVNAKKAIAAPPPPQPKVANGAPRPDPQVMPVSPGNGDFKKQLEHVYGHLIQYSKTDTNFRASVAEPKMGKVISADLEEGEDSFLLTVHIGKPGFKKPLHQPKTVNKPKAKPEPAPNRKSLVPKPEEVPEGHEVETKVVQTKDSKAPAIELKTEQKAPEEVEDVYLETEEYVQEAVLKPFPNFNVEQDCNALRKAMKGFGTDENAIIQVMGRRSISQRKEIYSKYKTMFGKDLVKDFDSELSGNFFKICKALCLGPAEYDASELRRAMKGLGTDEDCLIEIICTRTNSQIGALKRTYTEMFQRNLEEDIMSETSGHFKRLLISLLQANRNESRTFDREAAKRDAIELYQAGEKKFGTDESKFNEILVTRSNSHLRAMFQEYEMMSKMSMEEVIQSEMSGDLRTSMLTVVRCIQNKPAYFAKALQKSMKGLGTDDDTLLRIIITRCEVDMVQIKAAFQAEFGQTLGEWIRDDTSGDYRKILLILVGEEHLSK